LALKGALVETILASLSVSMSKFKKNPAEILRAAKNRTVAVLTHNKPAFYMVSPEVFEAILDRFDDERLTRLAKSRLKQRHRAVEITLDQL
jgi:antitoxin StbD